MKNLLYKEFKLCVSVQTLVFVSLSALIGVPSWPSLVPFIYPIAGFATIFPIALSNHDLLYTGILPTKKSDVVLGKVLLVGVLELISVLVSVPFAIIRCCFYPDAGFSDLGINVALYGIVLFAYAFFNIIFFPWNYRKPDAKNTCCFLVSTLVTALFLGGVTFFFIVNPSACEFINQYTGAGLFTQLGILAFGIVTFVLLGFAAYKGASKQFEKVNL